VLTSPLLALLPLALAVAQDADSTLAERISTRVAAVPGAVVGVAFHRVGTAGDTLYLNADASFHAASTMKVPVMIEVFRRADAGALSLDRGILLVNRFGSIVDGSPYALSASDDSERSLYGREGERIPLRELVRLMIVRSSNHATNAVIALVGPDRVTATARALGARDVRVLRGVEDGKAFEAGLVNTTTARDLATLLEAIERGTAASRRSCDEMRTILLAQEFDDAIPAGLPAGTRVAHKTGSITAVAHDAAIVYPGAGAPYVLVVLTRGIPEHARANALIAEIARLVHGHVAGARAPLDE
jgi:beta-lactamase class A